MIDRRTEELIAAYLVGGMTPEELAELEATLRRDPESQRAFASQCRQEMLLRQVVRVAGHAATEPAVAQSAPIRFPHAVRPPRRTSQRRRAIGGGAQRVMGIVAAAAAVVVMLLIGAALSRPQSATAPLLARLEAVAGEVTVTDVDGAARRGSTGDALHHGHRVRLGGGTSATIACVAEGATFRAADAADLAVRDGGDGVRIELRTGMVAATVAKQAPGRRVTVHTPEAEVTVVGTRFTVDAAGGSTDVAVSEGRVRVTQRSSGRSLLLEAGQRVTVSATGAFPPPAPRAPAVTAPQAPREPAGTAGVVAFKLLDADADVPIPAHDPLVDGATVVLSALPTRRLNILATTRGGVKAVRFSLDGQPAARTRPEGVPPFALAGDTGGDFHAWTPSPGRHVLVATAYSDVQATQPLGEPLTIAFTVDER